MLALCAVEPDWSRGIGHLICEGPVGNIVCVGCGHKAGPETVVQRCTRRVEGSLCDGVVFRPEAESDCVALRRSDGVWLEYQLAGLGTDCDIVVDCEHRTDHSGSSENGLEMHYDWL